MRESLRKEAYKAISVVDQRLALLHGLSKKIMCISDAVMRMRSHLVVSAYPHCIQRYLNMQLEQTTSEQNRRARQDLEEAALDTTLPSDSFVGVHSGSSIVQGLPIGDVLI
jgi:hypothetical protein